MRRTLERNPIGWLERRTWSARLVSWSWLAVLVALYSFALDDFGRGMGLRLVNSLVPWFLMFSIASSASSSFRRERELGVMELLLVSPLRVGQIVSGRVRGLWGQFLPAVLLLFGLWLYLTSGHGMGDHQRSNIDTGGILLWVMGLTFITLPVIGLFFSLRCRNYVVALFLTVLAGVVLPIAILLLVERYFILGPSWMLWVTWIMALYACGVLLRRALTGSGDYRRVIALALGLGGCLVIFFLVADVLSDDGFFDGTFDSADGCAVLLLPALQAAIALGLGLPALVAETTPPRAVNASQRP
jgi:ABC-type transport system involved in multi-copper enzyme maturation permease subunit